MSSQFVIETIAEKLARYQEMLRAFINIEAESAEPDYIREVLNEIGMTKNDAEEIGVGYLFDEE